MKKDKPTILISACLIGVNCRYDGGNCFRKETERLKEEYNLIPFCPEEMAGLGTPRPRAEFHHGDGKETLKGTNKIIDENNKDVTDNFILGSRKVLELAKKHKPLKIILKEKSPSCGVNIIKRKGESHKGIGVTTALLEQNGFIVDTIE